MLNRFPPAPAEAASDPSFLTGKTETFAKLKVEKKAGQRTVMMTEHTLIFVLKGDKLLHFHDHTVRVSPGEVILLRKGIYVMAEYIEDGQDFEAMMLFLSGKVLRQITLQDNHTDREAQPSPSARNHPAPFLVFPATAVVSGFRDGLRKYFETTPSNFETLLPLKQQEILLLLLSGNQGEKVRAFIRSAISAEPADIDYIVHHYLLQPVSIAELASLANCSLAKFKRDFQQRYQCSPRSWITTKRLAHAQMLLRNTTKQVAEIALDCGFESVSHFIRLYRQEFGHTPAAGRAKMTME